MFVNVVFASGAIGRRGGGRRTFSSGEGGKRRLSGKVLPPGKMRTEEKKGGVG